jgi:predicted membrane protein
MIANLVGSIERTHQRWDGRSASPVLTLLGSIDLDFRQAALGPGETEVVVASAVGSVKIALPEDLPVSVTGLTLTGRRTVLEEISNGFGHGVDHQSDEFAATGGRRLRLAVFSGVGSVEVIRMPATPRSRAA